MATARFDNLDPDKQEAILDAAAEEFGEKGYEAASINQIIEKAGISKGSMYYYFEDKRDLFDTVLQHATERMLDMVGGFDVEEMTAQNFWEYLANYAERSIEELRRHEKYIRLVRSFHKVMRPNDPEAPGSGTMEWGRQVLHDILERGRDVGAIRTDWELAFLIRLTMALDTVLDQWLMEHWDEWDQQELEEFVHKQIALMRRVLSPMGEE